MIHDHFDRNLNCNVQLFVSVFFWAYLSLEDDVSF